MPHTRMTALAFLLFFSWRSLLIFLCLNLSSCLICNLNTPHNILMILGINVDQASRVRQLVTNKNETLVGLVGVRGHVFCFIFF